MTTWCCTHKRSCSKRCETANVCLRSLKTHTMQASWRQLSFGSRRGASPWCCVSPSCWMRPTTSRIVGWLVVFSQERQVLCPGLPKDDLQDSVMIARTLHPPSLSLAREVVLPKPPSACDRWRTMCVQVLLDASHPSDCNLVPFFKSLPSILRSTFYCYWTQRLRNIIWELVYWSRESWQNLRNW